MAGSFEGKVAFITGASSGIGAALALEFARQGARVFLAARREDRLREVAARVQEAGGTAAVAVCDVTDRASLDEAVARAAETFGGIDVAVANAGFGVNGLLGKLSTDDFRRQFDTNVFGVVDTVFAVLPHLKQSRGRLGIVSSVLGEIGSPATSAYCASKFAVSGFAESIYYELAPEGVSVTCIMPGVVASDIRRIDNRGVLHDDKPDSAPKWLIVPAEDAAREIVRALERRRPVVHVTRHAKVMLCFHRHFPRTFRAVVRYFSRRRLAQIEARKRSFGPPAGGAQ